METNETGRRLTNTWERTILDPVDKAYNDYSDLWGPGANTILYTISEKKLGRTGRQNIT